MQAAGIVYAIAAIAHVLASDSPVAGLLGDPERSWGALAMACGATCFVALSAAGLSSRDRESILGALFRGAVPVALYGLLQLLQLDPITWQSDAASPVSSTIGRSNSLGLFLAMVAACQAGWESRRAGGRGGRVALALCVACLLATLSRGALVAFLVAAAFALRPARLRRHWLLAAAATALLALLVLLSLGPSSSPERKQLAEARLSSAASRLIVWREALALASEHPWVGTGPNSFRSAFMPRYPPQLEQLGPRMTYDDAHNLFLNHLVEGGLLASGSLLVLAVAAVAVARRAEDGDSVTHAAAAGLLAYLVGAQFARIEITPFVTAWILLGLLGPGPRGGE